MIPAMTGNAGAATGSGTGLKGTGYRQVQTFSPEQMQLFQRLFGLTGAEGHLSKLASGSPEQFEALEAPAKRQFNEAIGGLASRFSGMGSGARRSSGFNLAGTQAAGDFAERLMSQRLGLQRQAISDLMGMSQQLLGQQPNALIPEQKPFWQELLSAGAGGLGSALGTGLGKFIGI